MISKVTAKGVLLMLAAQLIFVAAWGAIKFLGDRLPLFELVFFRGFFSLIILIPLTHFKHRSFRGRDLSTLFLRAFFGLVAMVMSFYAMIHMEMGNTVTLFNTLPIFVALLAPALLGEAFGRLQFALIIVAFVGITVVLKPDENILQGVSIYALLAGLMAALSMICIRKLRATDSIFIITLYFTIFTTVVSAPLAFMNFVRPTAVEWGWLVFIGVAITFAQLFMTKAYRLGDASTIAPFSYASVIGAYAAGLLFFSEIPDIWSIIGAAIIVAGGIGIMIAAPKAQRVPGSTPGARV